MLILCANLAGLSVPSLKIFLIVQCLTELVKPIIGLNQNNYFRLPFAGKNLSLAFLSSVQKVYTSSSVVYSEKLTRSAASIISGFRPIAVNTWLRLPFAQAEPLETQIPMLSR